MYRLLSTYFRLSLLPHLLWLMLLNAQVGCPNLLSETPEINFGNNRSHLVEGEPVVSITQINNDQGKMVGIIVQMSSYAQYLGECEPPKESGSQPLVQASKDSTTRRAVLLSDSGGITVIADQRYKKLDRQELAGGPWIYYLNQAEAFRRIHVPESKIDEFKADLTSQHPLEFVAKWCDNQAGKLLAERFDSLEEFRKKERRLLRR
jgi:hypothetical protein